MKNWKIVKSTEANNYFDRNLNCLNRNTKNYKILDIIKLSSLSLNKIKSKFDLSICRFFLYFCIERKFLSISTPTFMCHTLDLLFFENIKNKCGVKICHLHLMVVKDREQFGGWGIEKKISPIILVSHRTCKHKSIGLF